MSNLVLYPLQNERANVLYEILIEKRICLDGSCTGAGKSFIALSICRKFTQGKIIIVCPLAMIDTWNKLLQKYSQEVITVINYDKLKTNKTEYYNEKWLIPKHSLIIFDECHKMKSYKSQVSKLLTTIDLKDFYVYLISATISDNPMFLTNILVCVMKYFKNQYVYYNIFGCVRGYKGRGFVFNGDKDSLIKLHKLLFKNKKTRIGIRINENDIRDILPKQEIRELYLPIDACIINTIYDAIRN